MIDLKLLQKDFESMSKKLMRKGVDAKLLEKVKVKFEELKEAKVNFETLQAAQNAMSKEFGVYKREGKDISELKAKVDENKIRITDALGSLKRLQWQFQIFLMMMCQMERMKRIISNSKES